MDLPLAGGGMLAFVALLLGVIALVSLLRLMGATRRIPNETEASQVERKEMATRERARLGFLVLAILFVLACASVFYVLGNIR